MIETFLITMCVATASCEKPFEAYQMYNRPFKQGLDEAGKEAQMLIVRNIGQTPSFILGTVAVATTQKHISINIHRGVSLSLNKDKSGTLNVAFAF